MITLTPLSASASSSSSSEPVSYLLELDEARILLDIGQSDYRASYSREYEDRIKELAPSISLLLLSHSESSYLGLYPYARANWGLTCPVYATQPTVEMGRVVCLSEAQSWRDEVQVQVGGRTYVPTVEQIHEAFDWIKSVRYNQPLHLGGDLAHLLLTPFPSGHTLGGTLFKLRSPTSGTILYATGINHTGERHLDGMVGGRGYDEGLIRPDLLIVEAGRANIVNQKRKEREKVLIDTITQTLNQGKSVLMPCDPSPRLLELLVLLDQHWSFRSKQRDFQHPLCLVSRTGQDVVSFAKSLVEWMGGLVKDTAAGEDILAVAAGKKRRKGGEDFSTLDFRHVRFFASPADLLQAFPINRPKVVLAVPPNMSHGPSRWLFTAMASTEGNVILLTGKGDDGTLTRELHDGARDTMELDLDSKVPLAGIELENHLEAERQAHEKEAATKAAAERSRRMLEADDLDSDSDSDSESGDVVQNANDYTGREVDESRQMSFDIYVKGQQTRAAKGMARYRMFPFIERRARMDDYGEGLDIGKWLRKGREIAEEGETEEVREAKRKKEAEDKKMNAPPEPPSKYITERVTVMIKASVVYVDMEGLHDGQAIKTIIGDLQPRKLILVRSQEKATQSMRSHFSTIPTFSPSTNETIKIGEHVQSYSLILGDGISSQLSKKWAKFEGYEVAMVDGRFALGAGSTIPKLELDLASKVETDLPASLFVGDLKLAYLKGRLNEVGIPAEFAGEGVLVCGPGVKAQMEGEKVKAGSMVAVRKGGEGQVMVEGSMGRVYWQVRKEVYTSLALVPAA